MKLVPQLGYYRTHTDAHHPVYGTDDAACFDIRAFINEDVGVKAYDRGSKFNMYVFQQQIPLNHGIRCLIPTGLIFDIPRGYSLRLHARSGLAWKNGIRLANSEGVIDSDYVDPTFIMLEMRNGPSGFRIKDGDRIAQAELVKSLDYQVREIKKAPSLKSDRNGGLGSTGII